MVVDVVEVVSLEMEAVMAAAWSGCIDDFLAFVAGECALGDLFRNDVSLRRLLQERGKKLQNITRWIPFYCI